MYTLLNVIGRVVGVLWLILRVAVVGLILVAAVVGFPYLLAMIILWLRAHGW